MVIALFYAGNKALILQPFEDLTHIFNLILARVFVEANNTVQVQNENIIKFLIQDLIDLAIQIQ